MSESFATLPPGDQQAPHPSRGIIFCPRCVFGTCFGIANSFSGAAKGPLPVLPSV